MIRKFFLSVLGVTAVAATVNAAPVTNGVVINEGYGGGGNNGAKYKNDFVELYNNSTTDTVNIAGYQVNYFSATQTTSSATATGTDNGFSSIIPAGTTLAPGAYYLIQEGVGAGGTDALPSPNLVDGTAINMSGSAFALQLIDSTGTLLDTLGIGTSTKVFETTPTGATANATSAQRKVDGVDTDINSADFAIAAPTPGSANTPEPASLAVLGLVGLAGLRRRK